MDANHDAHLSVEEFIKVLIKAEDSLKGKITNLKSTLELNYRQKREVLAPFYIDRSQAGGPAKKRKAQWVRHHGRELIERHNPWGC